MRQCWINVLQIGNGGKHAVLHCFKKINYLQRSCCAQRFSNRRLDRSNGNPMALPVENSLDSGSLIPVTSNASIGAGADAFA